MAILIYNEAKYSLAVGTLDLSTDTVKAMLVTTGYIVDPTHAFVNDGTLVAPNQFEVAGTGYVAGWGGSGRREVLNKSVIRDTGVFRVRLFGDDLLWNLLNVGVVGGLILLREGAASDTDSLLIGYCNEGGFPVSTDGGELQVRWHINGILAL